MAKRLDTTRSPTRTRPDHFDPADPGDVGALEQIVVGEDQGAGLCSGVARAAVRAQFRHAAGHWRAT